MSKNKLLLFIFLSSFIIMSSFFLSCGKSTKNKVVNKNLKKTEEVIIPVETTFIKQGEITKFLEVSGDIKTDKEIKVSSKLASKVIYVAGKEGDSVSKGQTLVKLEAEDLLAQLQQAKASVYAAQSRLKIVQVGARPEEKKQVENMLASAQSYFNSALKDYQRMEVLHNHGSISDQSFEQVKLKYEDAKTKLDSAKQQLVLVDKGPRIEEKQSAQAQVMQAQAQVKYLQSLLAYTNIKSPCNCLISLKSINVGELAAPGYPLIALVDNHNLFFEAEISEKNTLDVKVGQSVIINIDGIPSKNFSGQVIKIYPEINVSGRNFKAKVILINKNYLIKTGMFARGKITLQKKSKALLISKDGIFFNEEIPYVFLVKDNLVQQKNVSLGITDNKNYEILSGVNLGDEIVISAGPNLKNNSKVKVVNGN